MFSRTNASMETYQIENADDLCDSGHADGLTRPRQTSGDDPSPFSVGPPETPLEFVIVEGKMKGSIENRNDGLRPGRSAE
jgi:hypothetical protein